jgi:hypothetical protein
MSLDRIPSELKALSRFVAWREETRDGKPTKIPVDAKTGHNAAVDRPETWANFGAALAAVNRNGNRGIGFVLTEADPYTVIDLDKCRDPDTGTIEPWAWKIIRQLNSFTEISPSGRGLHIWAKGKLPPGGRRKGHIEAYSDKRYLTLTGAHLEKTPGTIEARQKELEALHHEVFGRPKEQARPQDTGGPALDLADSELLGKAKQDPKFARLFAGDWSEYPSQSEADQALCNKLAFWGQKDPQRMDRLFRQSGLMRGKWERPDYRERTINKALESTTEVYTPRGNGTGKAKMKPRQEAPDPGAPRGAAHPKKPASPAIQFVSAAALEHVNFPEPQWVVEEIIPEGSVILAGRPKLGKSWLALDIAVTVAAGGTALGKANLQVNPGGVLYLALEDRLRRIKRRLKQILGDMPFPPLLILAEAWPRLDMGGLEALAEYLKEHQPRLVVIDTLAKVRPPRRKNVDPYEHDMAMGGALQALANQHQCCILVVHHTRKTISDDFLDDVSGTTGITGAADAVLVLKRGRGKADATLSISGRDVEEQELALKFHPQDGLWELLGDATEYARSQQRLEISAHLKESGPQTPKEIAKELGKPYGNIKKMLQRMAQDGELKNVDGKYFPLS